MSGAWMTNTESRGCRLSCAPKAEKWKVSPSVPLPSSFFACAPPLCNQGLFAYYLYSTDKKFCNHFLKYTEKHSRKRLKQQKITKN
jgi:hypothetical protein